MWWTPLCRKSVQLVQPSGEILGRRALGDLGEQIAASYLSKQGGKVLVRNFSAPRGGEADLVMRMGGVLVFVEVKTRRHDTRYRPAAAVDRNKRRLLRKACNAYTAMLPDRKRIPIRFDIVEILVADGRPPDLHWIRNAFGLREGA